VEFICHEIHGISRFFVHPCPFCPADGNPGMGVVRNLCAFGKGDPHDGTADGTDPKDTIAAVEIEAVWLFDGPADCQVNLPVSCRAQLFGGRHVPESEGGCL
jgi:hypothetical protein